MFSALQGEPESKSTVDYENRGHEQENIKSYQIIPANALRSPRAMMVVSFNAYIAVLAVDSSAGYMVSALSAKTKILKLLHGSANFCLFFFCDRPSDAWVTQCNKQVRQAVTNTNNLGNDLCPVILRSGVDISDEEETDKCKDNERCKEAKIYIHIGLQSGPRKSVRYLDLIRTRFLPQERQLSWRGRSVGSTTSCFDSSSCQAQG